ncbi:hypothetical protein BGZ70_000903 [Mortierella alpina]|uniref:Uncharacterized protein n=1 Tax=Mortierella alpina TaxID=64518 RepID=A0A9P6LXI0_MORAP|nr:hypothetical protein BGZ70_000903 [Mortierella alpina]
MDSSPQAPFADTNPDHMADDHTPAPPALAGPQYVSRRLQHRSTYLPMDHSSVRSPHTTAAPLFTGVLEPSSAPEYPCQDLTRAPHTTAAPLWTHIMAASSAPTGPQKTEVDSTEEATSDRNLTKQGQLLPPSTSGPISPPAYGNPEQQFYTTPESQAYLLQYAADYEQPHQCLNQDQDHRGARSLPNNEVNTHNSGSPHEKLHAPVNTLQGLLPPGGIKKRRKAIVSCCVFIILLAIIVGVVLGMSHRDNTASNVDQDVDGGAASPPRGGTRNTTSNPTLASDPTRALHPTLTFNPTLTSAILHSVTPVLETLVGTEPAVPGATTAKATTTTTTETTTESPTPTSKACTDQCSDKHTSCSYGCYYSDTLCQKKCDGGTLTPESNACGVACRYTWSGCNQECGKSADACAAQC